MSTKASLFARLFGTSDTAPASDCCDVQIVEEAEEDVVNPQPQSTAPRCGSAS
ncbi:hypothetical protein [Streptomyces sp. TBY4]|uniref:hypothetical protein n=1 Tax=Streptomyces sp. TBY4 TaxID=2962030 RepID=UPI0020B8D24D|nr:hypothetical protein [Streptomyces sp. TBY4]MCP3758883.1 hypothetical protein [Streptomyces sp. TBY4]